MVKIKLHDKDKDMVEIYSASKDGKHYIVWAVVHSEILQDMEGVSSFELDEMDFQLLAEPTNK